ncbi:MAG TPA: FAD-dependent thymidylate synthase [Firmicutes bacterium]|nr:FAD-dependent thymidylate synthase [Bacillota bacterium]
MKVSLIAYTPDPERVVAAAARLCYSPVGATEVLEGLTGEQIARFLDKLVEAGHESPTEHASFTFAIEGVSRALSHQLVRHRIASYSQQSQRYVREDEFEYVTPPTIAAVPEARELFLRTMAELRQTYARLAELVPREDARYVLPNACETKLVVTMNARSLKNFFELRCCTRAQWEIRQLAEAMLAEVRKVAPGLFRLAGPTCETRGHCREGRMTCGRLAKAKRQAEGEV